MALNGSFSGIATGTFGLVCNWSGSQSTSGNYTDVTVDVYLQFYNLEVGARTDGNISIGNSSSTFSTPAIKDYSQSLHKVYLTSKTVRINHRPDGTSGTVPISVSWRFSGTYSGVSIQRITASTNITLDTIQVVPSYLLSISAGTGSSVSVYRTSSGYGGTGYLYNNATLYDEDRLIITFSSDANYELTTHTVNYNTFTSGNTYIVSGNVYISSSATVRPSVIGATDANIGSVSTITVTKYNSYAYHSISYSFGSLRGYITSSGGVSSSEVIFSDTSIPFSIPATFYSQIPNAASEKCTLTCTTYRSTSMASVGDTVTCQFTVTAPKAVCSPVISCSAIDTNDVTKGLTGDENIFIRYKSIALCSITATPQYSASIVSAKINDKVVAVTPSDSTIVIEKSIVGVADKTITFSVTDSRQYTTTQTLSPTMVDYIQLTINPKIYRPSSIGSDVVMSFSGNCYRGSFGGYQNEVTIMYRYRESGENVFGEWITVPPSSYIIKSTGGYSTVSDIFIGSDFDYKKSYVFQLRAYDGMNGVILSSITETYQLSTGTPVFDWGENDINFHVPIKLGSTTLTEEQLQRLIDANIADDQSLVGNFSYEGVDLGVKFADEIAAAPYNGDPAAWIKGRIASKNYKGLHLRDYFTITCLNGTIIKPQIMGINTYKGSAATEIGDHIDFISKDCWPGAIQYNPVNYNNGIGLDKFTGDGATTVFQLCHRSATTFPTLSKVTIGGADAATGSYTYDATTGVLTFNEAPASGAVIKAVWATPITLPFLASKVRAFLMSEKAGVPNEAAADPALIEVDYTNGGVWKNIPDNWKAVIADKLSYPGVRYTIGTLRTSDHTWEIQNLGKLWLPDECEVYGCAKWGHSYAALYGRMYPGFLDGNRKKGDGNGAARTLWWLLPATSGNSTYFCYVHHYGHATSYPAAVIICVPVCFRITG